VASKKINPVGFKIALELYVKCACKSSSEVPFSFGVRVHGESKLTGKVIINYLTQLWELYQYQYPGVLPILMVLSAVIVFFLASKVLKLM
jgi:dolichol-phosphate mannosyltransferase